MSISESMAVTQGSTPAQAATGSANAAVAMFAAIMQVNSQVADVGMDLLNGPEKAMENANDRLKNLVAEKQSASGQSTLNSVTNEELNAKTAADENCLQIAHDQAEVILAVNVQNSVAQENIDALQGARIIENSDQMFKFKS